MKHKNRKRRLIAPLSLLVMILYLMGIGLAENETVPPDTTGITEEIPSEDPPQEERSPALETEEPPAEQPTQSQAEATNEPALPTEEPPSPTEEPPLST